MIDTHKGSYTTEAAAEWVPLSALRPWGDNPRRNDAAVPAVVDSIRRFGFGAPILARRANGEIIAGHTRLRAAEALGLDRVPVRYLDLDPADAHLLALADNKIGEVADWDEALLAAALADLKTHDVELLTGSGFSQRELDGLLREPDFAAVGDDEQGQLDERAKTTCPACGHEFASA